MLEYPGQSRSKLFSLVLLAPLAAGCDEPAPPITIQTGNPPALVAYLEEGMAGWEPLVAAEGGGFELEASGPYRVVIVCEGSGGGRPSIEVKQYARTPEDGRSIEHACARAEHPFHLRGRVAQSAVAYFGGFSRAGFISDWELDLPVAPGSADLVMLASGRIGIQRDIEITGDTQLGAIDVSPTGTEALVPISFTVSNPRQGELISASTRLETGSTVAMIQSAMSGSGGWSTTLAPERMLRETDRQTAILSAAQLGSSPAAQNHYRTLERDVRVGDPTAAALPEPLGPVTFAIEGVRLTATWSALPEHDELALRWHSITMQETKDHVISLSRTFLDATGATSASLELRDIPGFKDEWRHAPGSQQAHELTASRTGGGEKALSQVNEWVYPSLPGQ
jgi:hypothetical protein